MVGQKHSWKYLSLIGDERIINLQRTKVYVFSDSVLCLGKIHQNPESNEAWKKRIEWITSSQSYRDFDGISGEPTEFEWNIFPGFDTLQLYGKVKDLLSRSGETPDNFTGIILFMSMFNDISCGTKDNERECLAHAEVVSFVCKKVWYRTMVIHWSRFRKEVVFYERGHKESGTISRKRCCWNSQKAGCPIFRATTPLSRGQLRSKGHGKLSIHFAATQAKIETVFRIIVSANQLSLYGAVAEMCEEYESYHDRTGRPQYCHVGNTAKQCRLGLFQDSDFAGDLEDSKSTSGGTLCVFGSHTFVPISWMCKKPKSVSHSSTESEIIS